MKHFFLISFLSVFSTVSVFCGPFGIEMGMSLEEVTKICTRPPVHTLDDSYIIAPSKAHDMFVIYFVQIDPEYGVYAITARSNDIPTNSYGTGLMLKFDDLVESLEKTYGKYERYDFLLPKSIWDDPQNFMMGMMRGDRTLMTIWKKGEGSNLPDNIEIIALAAFALSQSEGYVILEYRSPDKEKIDAVKKARQDSAF